MTVFISGLMVGRTPEFLGKKVEAREMKIATFVALLHPFVILVFTAISSYVYTHHPDFVESEGGWLNNLGFHGLSEQLYEYTSSAANNGSGFEGLGDNYIFLELDMWHCTYPESVYSDCRTGSHCRTIGSKKVYSRECRYLENGYCDFCSNDFCRHFHCCSFVFLPCTCVEYNRRTFKFIRIAG